MTLDYPNCFLLCPNHFRQVQIRLFWTKFYKLVGHAGQNYLDLTKQIRPIQNNWYWNKIIWMIQNHFGPIEGQGMYYLSLRIDFRRKWQIFFVRYLDVLLRSNGIWIG